MTMLLVVFISFGVIFALSVPKNNATPENPNAILQETHTSAAENKPAPDFTLKNLQQQSLTLSQLKGKVVMLNFWASWCEPCKEEMPSMQRLYKQMQGKPFEIIAVSIDKEESKMKEFLTKFPVTFPILRDPDEQIAKKHYAITGVPETFVIDSKGNIIRHVIGSFDWDHPQLIELLKQLLPTV